MLAELGASHTGYLTRDDAAYYDIADIFSGALRHELPRFFPNGEVAYDGIGIFTEPLDGKIFVSGLLADLPAAQAGLKTGDEIVAAGGAAFDPVASFAGKAGQAVHLTIRRTPDGPTEDVAVTPRAHPRRTRRSSRRSGRARGSSTRAAVRSAISISGPMGAGTTSAPSRRRSRPARSRMPTRLVWDLRDGWGGTAEPSYLDRRSTRAARP